MTDAIARLNGALSDRYRIHRELGRGGMATVYLADDLKHDRKVALKVLKPELAAVVGADRFLAEIKTTANLQHPHILPLFDSGEADGFLYYVMPYVDGESLRDRLDREGELPVEEAVRIATSVANALDYAHRHEVIHRDIKPANILLHDGEPIVADFGIALAVSAAGGGGLTETGLSLGTPYYMSPEQATAERKPNQRSDLYSLACVLFEMLAGEPPFTGSNAQAVVSKILTADPVALGEVRSTVPPHVEAAVAKALRKRPADRFASASEMASALANEAFKDPGFTRRGLSGAGPRKNGPLVGLAVATLIFAGLAAFGWMREGRAVRPVEYLPLALRNPDHALFAWNAGLNLSPDGNRVAYIGHGRQWWLLDLGAGTDRSTPLNISGNNVAFSPSGDSLAHTTSAWLQQIYVMDLATGRATQITDSAQGRLNWGRDGWIYFKDQLDGIVRINVRDGTREHLVHPGPGDAWHALNPSPLPDGEGVLYTRIPLEPRRPADAEIFVFDLRTRTSKSLTRGIEAEVTPSGHLVVAQIDGSLLAAQFDAASQDINGSLVKVIGGIEVRELWETSGAFSLGEDGSLLYVESRPIVEDTVVIVGRDGRYQRVLPTWGGFFYGAGTLAYSETDDRWAGAVHRGLSAPNIFVREMGTAEPRRLTFGDVLDIYPQFIPGTDDLAFVSPRGGNNWDLYRVPFDGAGTAMRLLDRPGDIRGPRFTADGRWVVFCEGSHSGQRDVVAHRFEPDSVTLLLVATEAEECDPDVSPDVRWLAYTSDRSGRTEVYVRPFGGELNTRWQVSPDGGTNPGWSESGRELFYTNPANELVSVPVMDRSPFSPGSPMVLFSMAEGTSWTGETASSDREFILVRKQENAPGQVVLIRNFLELVREMVVR